MPSAFRARAKPLAALTFMDGFLLAPSYRDESVLSRSTVVSLRNPDGLPSQCREERAHDPSSPRADASPGPRPGRRPSAHAGGGAVSDDMGAAYHAVPHMVRPRRAHRDHHHHEGPLRGPRRDGEADAR